MIARAAAVLLALTPGSAGAAPVRPALALTATPAHVSLVGAARQVIRVFNRGTGQVVVDASPAGFALGLRGAPEILLRGASAGKAASWVQVLPRRIVLAGGASGELTVTSRPPRGASAGDHAALVLLTTRPPPDARVAVSLRVGVTVMMRVPGRTRHALVLRALHAGRAGEHRVLQLLVVNAGNVVESLRRGGLQVSLVAGTHVVATLRSQARELLPRSAGLVELLYRGGVRGPVTVRVSVIPRAGPPVGRTFHLRL